VVTKAGEMSRSSDSKRRALAEGKSVRISYLLFTILLFLTFLFLPLHISIFKTLLHARNFSSTFSIFSQKSKNIFEH